MMMAVLAAWTFAVSAGYAAIALIAPAAASVLTIPFVALLIIPCLYINYLHFRRDRNA
jgi:hypothetical protein